MPKTSTTSTPDPYLPSGTAASGPWQLEITPASAGWDYTGLKIAELDAGGRISFPMSEAEGIVLPLQGTVAVSCDGETMELAGRSGVFDGPTDFAYVPRDSEVVLESSGGGRFAVTTARAERRLPFRYGPVSDVPVFVRGAGQCSREVHDFAGPQTFEADRLIAVEVITPAGNWSSWPPHKHDEEQPGEAILEEIYYYEIAAGPAGPGLGYQRVYGTPERPIDVFAEVRAGDAIVIPHGWHGPAMAAPGYDMYYLNVMAGPGAAREWLFSDDPDHVWVKETWETQPPDPRLPLRSRT